MIQWARRSFLAALLLSTSLVSSQQPVLDGPQEPAPAEAKTAGGVPRVVRFSGVLRDASGQPVQGSMSVSLQIFAGADDAQPLWSETQTIQTDEQGRYSVLLGASSERGLPAGLFTSGDARWLEVRPEGDGGGPQARIMLVSVPYALKAADAETLGGRPASEYQLKLSPDSTESTGAATGKTGAARTPEASAAVDNGGVSGTVNRVTKWTSGTNIGDSLIFDNGTNIGIGTASPASKLHITDSIGAFGALRLRMQNTSSGGYTDLLFNNDTTGYAQFGISGSATSSAFGMGNGAAYLQGGTTTGMGTVVSAPFILGTNNVERMRIDATGKVGIGTAFPADLLHLNGTVGGAGAVRQRMRNNSNAGYTDILIQNDSTGTAQFGITGSATSGPFGMGAGSAYLQGGATTGMGTVISAPFILGTNNAERMRIDATGLVGIGTAFPSALLHLNGSIGGAGAVRQKMQNNNSGGYTDILIQNDSTGTAQFGISGSAIAGPFGMGTGSAYLQGGATTGMGTVVASPFILGTNNVERMRIDPVGNVGIGITSPSLKLEVAGVVRSSTGGFKFPDATTQTTAVPSCTTDQIPKWAGSGWTCGADAIGGGGVTLPFSATGSTASAAFKVTQNNSITLLSDPTFAFASTSIPVGIVGVAANTTNTAVGVAGLSNSPDSPGIVGWNGSTVNTGSDAAGVIGLTDNPTGVGVSGEAHATTGIAIGVRGETSADAGIGVYGHAKSVTGANIGVIGEVESTSGIGVKAQANGDGNASGVAFKAEAFGGPVMIGIANGQEAFRVQGNGITRIIKMVINNTQGGDSLTVQNNGTTAMRVDASGSVRTNGQFLCPTYNAINNTGCLSAGSADFAESFAVRGEKSEYQPGDVMVIDTTGTRRLTKSGTPYSRRVAGIYSTRPLVLGNPGSPDAPERKLEVPLAMVGVVPCKVSAENGPIHAGDLLVTSSRPGYAMRGTDHRRMNGAVVGKALQDLRAGNGVIEVLVTLQ